MTHVSDIFAFVLANGPVADAVLFRDEDEPLAGLTDEEQQAIDDIEPHLKASWIGLLSACREAFWALADGQAAAPHIRTRKTQARKMYENDEVAIPLVTGRLNAGFTLDHWGADAYHLYIWVWAHKDHLDTAERAVADVRPAPWRNEHGSFLLTLATPTEGQSFEEIGAAAAARLWEVAGPIARAIHARPAGT